MIVSFPSSNEKLNLLSYPNIFVYSLILIILLHKSSKVPSVVGGMGMFGRPSIPSLSPFSSFIYEFLYLIL